MLAFFLKLALTAAVVVGVTRMVDRFGPMAGGIAVGLPIVIGPGYLFLSLERSPAYVAEASLASLAGMLGILAFLVVHVRVAPGAGPVRTLALSTLGWAAASLAVAAARPGLGATLAALGAASLLARLARGSHDFATRPASPPATPAVLLARSVPAGLLVAAVSGAAASLGDAAAGILLTYPVGMTAVGWIVHRHLGGAVAAATMAAAQTGILGVFAFVLVVHLAAGRIAPLAGVGLGIAASLLPGIAMVAASRRRATAAPGAR